MSRWDWDVARWYSAGLPFVRPWVQSPGWHKAWIVDCTCKEGQKFKVILGSERLSYIGQVDSSTINSKGPVTLVRWVNKRHESETLL